MRKSISSGRVRPVIDSAEKAPEEGRTEPRLSSSVLVPAFAGTQTKVTRRDLDLARLVGGDFHADADFADRGGGPSHDILLDVADEERVFLSDLFRIEAHVS